MQALERPEGSAGGISYLTTRNVYEWRKKPFHQGDGTTSERWKRRSRLVAREFVSLKEREMTFLTSGFRSVRRKKQEREKEHFLKR